MTVYSTGIISCIVIMMELNQCLSQDFCNITGHIYKAGERFQLECVGNCVCNGANGFNCMPYCPEFAVMPECRRDVKPADNCCDDSICPKSIGDDY